MECINEYHRWFPNQLAAASLIHTITRAPATPMIAQPARPTYQLTRDDHIAMLEAKLFNLRARLPQAPVSGIRTRGQKAREQEEIIEEIITPAARQTTPEVPAPVVPVTSIPTEPPIIVADRQPRIQEEPEHPYQKAKDAAYVPPVNRNVGAPAKPPTQPRAEPAYKTLPSVHDAAIAADVYKQSMEAPITITQ